MISLHAQSVRSWTGITDGSAEAVGEEEVASADVDATGVSLLVEGDAAAD
jgi:hypothetical protein